jgi:DNA-binding LacI/PurR family transcriptional regulator
MGIGHDAFAYLARGETLYKEAEFISGQRVYARERLAGYKEALAENDFEPRVHMLPGLPLWKKDTWKKMERAVEEFLTELPSPAGLFVVDDALASVALRVAERTDIAVPQSLSVLGFGDDVNYCHASLPTLSSIPYPAQAVGYRAAKELARQIAGEETGDRRQETGDRRQGTGDRGQETRGRRYVSLWMPYIAASRPISSPSTMLKRRCSSAGLGGPRRAPRSALRTSWSRRLTPTAP